jgi:hypothetical protein
MNLILCFNLGTKTRSQNLRYPLSRNSHYPSNRSIFRLRNKFSISHIWHPILSGCLPTSTSPIISICQERSLNNLMRAGLRRARTRAHIIRGDVAR